MKRFAGLALLVCACGDDAPDHPADAGVDAPSDPCSVPLDRSIATDFYDAARCLFEGPGARQHDVDPATFDRERIAIVRGRLLAGDGTVLADARVGVLDHAEYGYTMTRDDGTYDLAINGGGSVTVTFERAGSLAAQRHVLTRWRRFAVIDDVTLIARAPGVAVDLATAGFVAGATSTDASGARASALYFAPGTTATAAGAPLTSFTLHTSEYTVGERGPSAMPGDLPAASAYTYAIAFGVDEAHGHEVTLDPPAMHYVDNFLQFPTGTIIPDGEFDARGDTWRAAANGVVVAIVDGGIDSDGDGKADALVGDAERAAVLQRYPVGATLWRVPIPTLSGATTGRRRDDFSQFDKPYDHNLGYFPPADATEPQGVGDAATAPAKPDPCDPKTTGSVIGCSGQTLGEVAPVRGTPFTLHYQSERTAGFRADDHLSIQLAGSSLPASVVRIDAQIEILGKVTRLAFPPAPNAVWEYDWDGTDAYGRAWEGRQLARIRVGYVYDGVYAQTPSFGSPSRADLVTANPTRQQLTMWKEWESYVGRPATSSLVGGWTLSAVHTYDAAGGTLALGTGAVRTAEGLGAVITTYAGTGRDASTGDGGPATAAEIDHPHGIAIAPDGSVFFSEDATMRIRKVAPDGTISTYAGTGVAGFSGDGGPATQAQLSRPMGLALAPDGTLYVADGNNHRVRAISPQGIITTYAGGGIGFSDNIRATDAFISEPHALALDREGNLFIADAERGEIRRVEPGGTISLYAGGGNGQGTEGDRATSVSLIEPLGLCVGPQHELYVTEYYGGRVRRIDPDGRIFTVIGLGGGASDDGATARTATIVEPHTVDIGGDGSLYITEEGRDRVRRITTDGRVFTIAGGGTRPLGTSNITPLAATFVTPRIIYVGVDGLLWLADHGGHRVHRIRPSLPGYVDGEVVVASHDGRELYVFDDRGRHLRTLDALTGAATLTMGYDAAAHLVTLTDADGSVTTIERDAAGAPTGIVSAYGERTTFALDGGELVRLTDPAGAVTKLGYHDGLLTSLVEPRGDTHTFAYDALGRLTSDASPTGLVKTLTRGPDGVTTSQGGGASTLTSTTTDADTVTRRVRATDGTSYVLASSPDGATVTTPTASATVTYTADPRFGMQAPLATITTTSGSHTLRYAHARTATLADPSNPLSLQTLTDTVTINGRTTRDVWNAATLTRTTTSPAGRTTTRTYDAKGHLVTSRLGTLLPTTYGYDDHGLLSSITRGGRTHAATYDRGRPATITDPSGTTTALAHDAAGRLSGATLGDGGKLGLAYDANGNVTGATTPANLAFAWTYAPGNQPATYASPTSTATATYDAEGRLVAFDAGHPATLGYDGANRVSTIAFGGDVRSFRYDAAGRVAGIAAGAEQLVFDHDGDVVTRTTWSGDVTGDYTRELDDDLRVVADTSAGVRVTFTHDADGLLTHAGALTIDRTPEGLVAGTRIGTLSDRWTYNGFGEPTAYTAGTYVATFTRDASGRIASRTETIGGTSHTDTYAYDARGRLVRDTRDGVATTWEWDADGNRTTGATYDARGRLVALAGATLTYDATGALATRADAAGVTHYAYDPTGALAAVTLPDGRAMQYVIDPLGRRVGKRVDGALVQRWLYADALRVAAQLDGSGNLVARFVYGTRATVPDLMIANGTTYRLVSDHAGSVRLVVDTATGAIAQRIDYDAWGNIVSDSHPGFQPFGFAGGLYDPDTRLVHFGAREYDATAGRFTSPDPIGLRGGVALYLYAGGDPIDHIDPDGRFWWLNFLKAGLGDGFKGAASALMGQLGHQPCIDWMDVLEEATKEGVKGMLQEIIPMVLETMAESMTLNVSLLGEVGMEAWALYQAYDFAKDMNEIFTSSIDAIGYQYDVTSPDGLAAPGH